MRDGGTVDVADMGAKQHGDDNAAGVRTRRANADTFVKSQTIDEWRAAKLVGVTVVGADNKKIGQIKDVLIDHDGAAQVVVISAGGFLGVGGKIVGVPFKNMKWHTEGRTVEISTAPPSGEQRLKWRRIGRRRRCDLEDRPGCDRSQPGLSRRRRTRHDGGAAQAGARFPLCAGTGRPGRVERALATAERTIWGAEVAMTRSP